VRAELVVFLFTMRFAGLHEAPPLCDLSQHEKG